MFFWIGVILLVGFVMYRVGKSTGSSSTREEIKKQRLRRKIAERKAAESGTQMAGQTVMPAAGGKNAQGRTAHPVSHGHPGSYRHAVAAGVLGAVAGAALMHDHDEESTQGRLGQMARAQQAGNDLSGDAFLDDSYDGDDTVNPDETQDDTAYDVDESNDGADDNESDYDDNDSSDDDYSNSDSDSDDGGSFFDDVGSFFGDDDDDGFF